jgi:uroporphyrin-III C-methyltransferase
MVVVGQVVRLRAALDWLGAIGGRSLKTDPLGTRHHEQTGS